MAKPDRRKIAGLLLCLGAVATLAGGWAWAHPDGRISTDNAYVRGDVTALAPTVDGYVTAVAIADNQAARAGDVLFRIADRDYLPRLAQPEPTDQSSRPNLPHETGRRAVRAGGGQA